MTAEVVDWLLEDDAAGVEYLARRDLLDESPRSRRMTALRRRANDYPPVARMLERVDEALAEKAYQKYRGGFWTLIFLADMQADGRDPRLRRLARHVLARQLENGGFAPSGGERNEIVCLTANLLRALVALGWGRDERVRRGYLRLAERILPAGGVPCRVIEEHSVMSSCRMTIPQTLRAVAAAPSSVPAGPLRRLRELLVKRLLEVRIWRYVRPDAARFARELVPLRPKGTSRRRFKADYRRRHPPPPASERGPKPGWLRFGFPASYNPDLLEAMLALAESGVEGRPAMAEALDLIEEARGRDGRWRQRRSLRGRMLAEVERRGRPSKWITLRALTVLRRYGRLPAAGLAEGAKKA